MPSPSPRPSAFLASLLLAAALGCTGEREQGPPSAGADTAQAGAPATVPLAAAKFEHPESVLHDTIADVYFVSNVNGDADAVDHNGFISRVRPDGTVDSLHFVLGGRNGAELNAPKGMALVGNTLWVTDIDALRAFDRRDGRAVGSIDLRSGGATFLNDLVLGPDGALYVSDTRANRIFRVGPDLQPSTPLASDSLQGPNGLLWIGPAATDTTAADSAAADSLSADSTRRRAAADSARRPPAADSIQRLPAADSAGATADSIASGQWTGLLIASFDGDAILLWTPADSALRTIARGPGGFDGLARLPDGRVVVSSLTKGGIYVLEGDSLRLLSDQRGVADLTADAKRRRLILPLVDENHVRFLDLTRLTPDDGG